MFARIHQKLGTAGFVVAIVALVAALAGTAIAAAGLTGKQKKEVTKIAKKYAGKKGATGPAGPAGPQGPAGAAGKAGADGSAGSNGAAGATGATGATGKGTTGATGATGATGTDGSPWVAGQAPSGVILKGTWAIPQYTAAAGGESIPAAVSTGVPIPPTGSSLLGAARGAGLDNGADETNAETLCPGTAENPTINTGLLQTFGVGGLCVYAQAQTNMKPPLFGAPGTGNFPLASSGGGMVALFKSAAAGDSSGYGSWVMVTPPSS
jgi:Collagen triple helix repeat (20 copies)